MNAAIQSLHRAAAAISHHDLVREEGDQDTFDYTHAALMLIRYAAALAEPDADPKSLPGIPNTMNVIPRHWHALLAGESKQDPCPMIRERHKHDRFDCQRLLGGLPHLPCVACYRVRRTLGRHPDPPVNQWTALPVITPDQPLRENALEAIRNLKQATEELAPGLDRNEQRRFILTCADAAKMIHIAYHFATHDSPDSVQEVQQQADAMSIAASRQPAFRDA